MKPILNENINIESLSSQDLKEAKNRLKHIEKKVKEKEKPKTITIPGDTHQKVKKHCKELNLTIGNFTTDVLIKEIGNAVCITKEDKSQEEVIDERKEELEKKYVNLNKILSSDTLIKTDYLLLSDNFSFKGYSIIDGKPIYQVMNKTFYSSMNNEIKKELNPKIIKKNELSTKINPKEDLDFMLI